MAEETGSAEWKGLVGMTAAVGAWMEPAALASSLVVW